MLPHQINIISCLMEGDMGKHVLGDVCMPKESNLNFMAQLQGKNNINIQVHDAKAGHVHV